MEISRARLRFRRGDICAIAFVLVLAAAVSAFFLIPSQSQEVFVEIRQDGKLLGQYPLSQDRTVTIGGEYANTVVIENGAVWVEAATCPGADCVHSGKISAAGRSIVCLPNRLEIRLIGEAGDVDMVVG